MRSRAAGLAQAGDRPRHNQQSHVPLGAGMGAEVVVVATALCIRPALGFIRFYPGNNPVT